MSTSQKIACIRQWNIDFIIVPVEPSFNYKTQSEQNRDIFNFQIAAEKMGLRGTVIPVWLKERKMRFVAPSDWHSLLRNLTWNYVVGNINNELPISE